MFGGMKKLSEQAWGDHWEFQDSVGLFQHSVATKYHSILFEHIIDVLFVIFLMD